MCSTLSLLFIILFEIHLPFFSFNVLHLALHLCSSSSFSVQRLVFCFLIVFAISSPVSLSLFLYVSLVPSAYVISSIAIP